MTIYAACRPEYGDTAYAVGCTDLTVDTEITDIESVSVDSDIAECVSICVEKVVKVGDKDVTVKCEASVKACVYSDLGWLVCSSGSDVVEC